MKLPLAHEVRKPAKTMAGVTPLTVVVKPRKCNHGTCIYCPGGEKVPQSYTNKSPAVMRALMLNYDPYEQVRVRLNAFKVMNHPTDKIELIILGGTFMQYPFDYQESFIKSCYDGLNECSSKNLTEAKKINETAQHRCVALCIENRPDNCSQEEIKRMLYFGCTRVEIGVQMPDDELYKKTGRGHTVKDVVIASEMLRDAGFKLGYHVMPGLPYSNKKKDLHLFKELFKNPAYRPDQLKIYPCQVIEDSPLAYMHEKINFIPYDEEETREILEKMTRIIPRYCRTMRIMREIPPDKLVKGITRIDIRRDVEDNLRKKKANIQEIRMRELGFSKQFYKKIDMNIFLKTTTYKASGGTEYFLEFVNKQNILFGLLRLRFLHQPFMKILHGAAIVRELHVYGQSLALGEKSSEGQHTGIGKQLMKTAESITQKHSYKKLAVISGVGVREYYRKLGYTLDSDGIYMIKDLE
ncbi:MAG: tRNA uridine(34) 5-carboxymethylaminomethyl modification radical SAM/GNAT enzyme Elp3 [Nanoarchaeota archaeon]